MELSWTLNPLWVFIILLIAPSEISVADNLVPESSNTSSSETIFEKYLAELNSVTEVNANGTLEDLDAIVRSSKIRFSNGTLRLYNTAGLREPHATAKVFRDRLRHLEIDDKRFKCELLMVAIDDDYFYGSTEYESWSIATDRFFSCLVSREGLRIGLLDMYYKEFSQWYRIMTGCEEILSISNALAKASQYWIKTATNVCMDIVRKYKSLWESEQGDSILLARDAMQVYSKNVNRLEERTREIKNLITAEYKQCQQRKMQ